MAVAADDEKVEKCSNNVQRATARTRGVFPLGCCDHSYKQCTPQHEVRVCFHWVVVKIITVTNSMHRTHVGCLPIRLL